MAIFKKQDSKLIRIKEVPFKKEKELQKITEDNLDILFGLQFVETEFKVQNLFIDTLAFDRDNKTFVIIEYKRDSSFSVVDQGFSYLSLMHHNKSDFVLTYNKKFNKNFGCEDIDWTQTKVILIAHSFSVHQRNAVNFSNMRFLELWEATQFDNDMLQYRRLEISDSAESLEQIKNIVGDMQKVAKEIKQYTEEDLFGKSGELHDLYISFKEHILQVDSDLTFAPRQNYVGFQITDNWRNIFNVRGKGKNGLRIDLMRSKPEDFQDPQKKIKPVKNSKEHWGQDISTLDVDGPKDLRYAWLIIQQAYDHFIKEFGN